MKLKDLKYPNVYYAKNRAVYLGNYSPERNDQVGGFSTQGQSRLQILSKLEENIRNKSIKIYSARLYEELKSFVWKGQKAQALNGHNDDLVMSLAIGAWLYDGMMGGNQGSQDLSKAIISGMSMSSRSKDDIVHSPAHRMPQNPFTPIKQEEWEKGNKSFDKKKGYGWLLD